MRIRDIWGINAWGVDVCCWAICFMCICRFCAAGEAMDLRQAGDVHVHGQLVGLPDELELQAAIVAESEEHRVAEDHRRERVGAQHQPDGRDIGEIWGDVRRCGEMWGDAGSAARA